MITPISYCLALYTPWPLVYTPACCFSRVYTLLSALVTINTTYAIYIFLIHHCTNSLSSLQIFVHHCTFCASLHTKTSPAALTKIKAGFMQGFICVVLMKIILLLTTEAGLMQGLSIILCCIDENKATLTKNRIYKSWIHAMDSC